MEYTENCGVDLIIDPIGSNNWKVSYKCLAPMGKLSYLVTKTLLEENHLAH